MQMPDGQLVPLPEFQKLARKLTPEEQQFTGVANAKPMFVETATGVRRAPQGKSLAEMNEAMKAAGWNREERRRYLAMARKDGAPDGGVFD